MASEHRLRHGAGAENWAIIASLIKICKLAVDLLAYLTATLTANSHKQSKIDELMP
ncbi:hypothetical protein [Rhizobium sp. NZLR1]|uniref:hypothetical protein n=1 Tax=Rhizobium sp. NZLR1 TaxID=2731096 RepID=UPI001C8398ED|nr:hypothetical protein [Rhizobium sp. NZLR1]